MCADVSRECLDAQGWSDELIAGDLPASRLARLQDHLSLCALCRRRHERRTRLWEALGRELVGVPNGVLAKTRRRVGEAVRPLASERPRRIRVAVWGLSRRVALAASFVVALALGMYVGPAVRKYLVDQGPAPRPSVDRAAAPRLAAELPVDPVSSGLHPAGSVYVERGRAPVFVRRTGDNVEVVRIFTLRDLERRRARARVTAVPASLELPQY